MDELTLLQKRIEILNADIERDQNLLAYADVIAGRMETAIQQRDRAIERLNTLLVADACAFPTFIGIDHENIISLLPPFAPALFEAGKDQLRREDRSNAGGD